MSDCPRCSGLRGRGLRRGCGRRLVAVGESDEPVWASLRRRNDRYFAGEALCWIVADDKAKYRSEGRGDEEEIVAL